MTVAVVTGSNSGLGRAAAVELASRGWTVYGTMRDLDRGAKLASQAAAAGVTVFPVLCDVQDEASVRRAVAEITADSGGIDVMVNNAGVGGNGVVEEATIEQYRSIMDVNVYGPIRCIQAVLPQMRERRSGAIVNVSSIAGRIAFIGQSPYSMSKWALEAVSENLAQEVAPFGIRVVIIEPGVFKTAIMAKTTAVPNASGAYDAPYRRMFAMYSTALASPDLADPSSMGAVIHEAVETPDPKLRWAFGYLAEPMLRGRATITDEHWVEMAESDDDQVYAERFASLLGLDISGGFAH